MSTPQQIRFEIFRVGSNELLDTATLYVYPDGMLDCAHSTDYIDEELDCSVCAAMKELYRDPSLGSVTAWGLLYEIRRAKWYRI